MVSRIDHFKPLQAFVQIDPHAFLYAEGTYASRLVSHQIIDPVSRDHLCLLMEHSLKLFVVDSGCPLHYDQDGTFLQEKGEGLCDLRRAASQSLCRFRNGGAGLFGNDNAAVQSVLL